jgi:glycosyltransferase involved in cell wall biosynthesis
MKILYIANLRLPTEKAHGVQIVKMCSAFASLGQKVTLVVPFRWNSAEMRKVRDIFAHYGVERNFNIVTLPSLDLFPLAFGIRAPDKAAFAIQYGTFLLALKAYLAMKGKKYDAIYTRDPRIARLAQKYARNTFLELHTIPKKDDVAAAEQATGVVTITRKLKSLLEDAAVNKEKIISAPDGADLPSEPPRASAEDMKKGLRLPLDAPLIGYAGRLTTFEMEKGIPELLDAFSKLCASGTRARLMVLGSTSENAKQYIQKLSSGDIIQKIHFLGRVAPSKVRNYLQCFDVLVAPFPQNEHYSFAMSPLKIFEYMAAARPIVVSDLPSIREVLAEDEAYFCKAGDVQNLAAAIKKALEDPADAKWRADNAKLRVRDYAWKRRAENILEFMAQRCALQERS